MKETYTYEEFINNILETRGRFACGDEYHERHHIVARCMGGTDEEDNLIDLFAREHFEAHRLLALENPDNEKLVYAWSCMAFVKRKDTDRYEVTAEEYEEARISLSNHLKGKHFGGNIPGVPKSEAHKNRLSAANKGKHNHCGKNNPNYGNAMSEESRQKMSVNRTNNYGADNPMYRQHHTQETKEKISRSNKGKNSGENNPAYGKRKEELKKKVYQYTKDNYIIFVYDSVMQAERETGISHSHISSCCNGKRKTAGGFIWRYADEEVKQKEDEVNETISGNM